VLCDRSVLLATLQPSQRRAGVVSSGGSQRCEVRVRGVRMLPNTLFQIASMRLSCGMGGLELERRNLDRARLRF